LSYIGEEIFLNRWK